MKQSSSGTLDKLLIGSVRKKHETTVFHYPSNKTLEIFCHVRSTVWHLRRTLLFRLSSLISLSPLYQYPYCSLPRPRPERIAFHNKNEICLHYEKSLRQVRYAVRHKVHLLYPLPCPLPMFAIAVGEHGPLAWFAYPVSALERIRYRSLFVILIRDFSRSCPHLPTTSPRSDQSRGCYWFMQFNRAFSSESLLP